MGVRGWSGERMVGGDERMRVNQLQVPPRPLLQPAGSFSAKKGRKRIES